MRDRSGLLAHPDQTASQGSLPIARAKTSKDQAPYRKGLVLLARREHSVAEMKSKLATRFGSAAAASAVARLRADGYLSDQRFAEALVRSRASAWGRRRLEQELSSKGVGEAVASKTLTSALSDFSETERATKLISQRYGDTGPGPDDHRLLSKCWRFLHGRGFDTNTIKQSLATLRASKET